MQCGSKHGGGISCKCSAVSFYFFSFYFVSAKKADTCWALLADAIACKEGKIVATRSFNCSGVLVQGMFRPYQKLTFPVGPRIDLWLPPESLKL